MGRHRNDLLDGVVLAVPFPLEFHVQAIQREPALRRFEHAIADCPDYILFAGAAVQHPLFCVQCEYDWPISDLRHIHLGAARNILRALVTLYHGSSSGIGFPSHLLKERQSRLR